MSATFSLHNRVLRAGDPPYVVAEIGINHNADFALAQATIEAAARAGAAAVKFQTFDAGEFMADRELAYEYESQGATVRESMYEMFKRLELPADWHSPLQACARGFGLEFLSSAADPRGVDLLVQLGTPAIKIASEDAINLPLLEYIGRQKIAVILSTGMASESEIDQAVETLHRGGCEQLMLLHCVSLYPTPDEEAHLARIGALRERYQTAVGYSDHTIGHEAAIAATVLGAVLIEKHFTLDRGLPGPDHALSADPAALRRLVEGVHRAVRQMGRCSIEPSAAERAARQAFRRSVVAAVDIPAGARITREMMCLKRPGSGIAPRDLPALIGMKTRRSLRRDEALQWEAVE